MEEKVPQVDRFSKPSLGATTKMQEICRADKTGHPFVRDTSAVLLTVATILGLGLRISAVAGHDFPLNDGGLFYTMVQDLIANGLRIPAFTSYNAARIPFVYPPLGLYMAAILSKAGVPLLETFRVLPAIVSAATVPVGYRLALKILGDRLPAAFAAFALAVIPAAFDWRIMGGGITRSWGFLFGLLTLDSALELLDRASRRSVLFAALFGTLTVLSHPEAAVHTILGVFLLCVFHLRRVPQLICTVATAFCVAALSAAWWVPAIQTHGLAPWLGAANSRDWIPTYVLLFRMVADLDAVTVVFALFGALLGRREPLVFLLAYGAFMFIVLPRSAAQFAIVPLAMTFGLGAQSVIEGLLHQDGAAGFGRAAGVGSRRAAWALPAILIFMFVPNWTAAVSSPVLRSLTPGERAAMEWAHQETAPGSAFLVVEGVEFYAAMNAEWFPALSGRVNAVAVQGYEWVLRTEIGAQIDRSHALQMCGQQGSHCVGAWQRQNPVAFDYVYVLTRQEPLAGSEPCCARLVASMLGSPDYEAVLQNPDVTIFRRRR